MAEITANGITIKTLLQWKAELDAIHTAIDPEWDVATNTPDGQLNASKAEMLANLDEAILDSYNAADPAKASGQQLDVIMSLSNVKRVAGTYSTATVQLSGTETTVVPAGTLIENAVTGTQWAVDSETVLGAGATSAAVTCTEIGAQTAGIGELTQIATPVSGLESVNNSASATAGQNEMTDKEARVYREETISNGASNFLDAVYSAVAQVDGVTHVATYTNRTGSPDSNGLPANSFAVIVNGGSDADVAQAIYNKLLPGIPMFAGTADVTETVNSEVTTNSEDITFNRAVTVPLYADVRITQVGNTAFTDAELAAIKQSIVDFSLGNLFDDEAVTGFAQRAWRIGEDINSGMLYTPANFIVGSTGKGYITDIYLDDAASPSGASTVAIDFESLATIDVANIAVTVS